ncbi:MAG: metallophosphoesterase, partial [Akkermansiaceae bacterium]
MKLAIGDIHGCLTSLETMLELVQPSSDDLIVTLGDYVDRGPDSKG